MRNSEEKEEIQKTQPQPSQLPKEDTPSQETITRNERDDSDDKNAFTKKEKWFIVTLIAFAGLFSPLTANIYFPAIPTLTEVFHKSTELINLTVTMYMILQGIAPMFWGTISDMYGRRPITAACLLVLSLSCVGLALTPTSAYWLLMVLRCLQAAGSASTIAIGAGVISDISTPAERGGFYGIFILGPMVGPAIGPVIGGALAQGLGWRSIFWFMCIAASICLVILVILMPETLASVAHRQGRLSKLIYKPVLPIVGRERNTETNQLTPHQRKRFQNPFLLFARLDILLLLILNAIICAVFYGVIASISTLFDETYPFLDETKIGLCFLAMGGGMAIGSSVNGKLLDRAYQFEKRRFAEKLAKDSERQVDVKTVDKLPDFPLEQARLKPIPVLVLIMAACVAGYGWALQRHVNIALPLILQVLMGYMSIAIMNGSSTLMIDLAPGQGSAVTACNNLVRCLLSAALVSVIQLIFDGIGIGWSYILLMGLTLLALPVILLELRLGPKCRKNRLQAAS